MVSEPVLARCSMVLSEIKIFGQTLQSSGGSPPLTFLPSSMPWKIGLRTLTVTGVPYEIDDDDATYVNILRVWVSHSLTQMYL